MNDGRASDDLLKKLWKAIPVSTRVLLVLVVLAAVAILVFDPAPAHHLREDLISLFLAAILAVGFAVALLFVITLSGGAFVVIWGRGYNEAKAKVQEHRGVAVPTFLSVFSGLTVTQATDAIGTIGSAEAILFGAAAFCFTVLGTMLQERADKYGDIVSWRWARWIGMVLVVLPLVTLLVVGVADDWWNYFLDADGIDQACLILTFVIEIVTVIAGWALNKTPIPNSDTASQHEAVQPSM